MAAAQEVKLFNKWNLEEIEISDMSLAVSNIVISISSNVWQINSLFYIVVLYRISSVSRVSTPLMFPTPLVVTRESASERPR